jgi:hypothetical protein
VLKKDCKSELRTRLNFDTIFNYFLIHSSHKPQFRYVFRQFITANPKNGEERCVSESVRNGRSAQQLCAAHPFNLLLCAANCDFVAGFEFEIVLLSFAVGNECAVG